MLFSSCTISFVLRLKAKKKRDFIIASYLLRGIVQLKGVYYRKWQESSKFLCGGGAFQERGFHHIGDLFVKAGVQINFQRGQFRLNGSLL